MQTSRGAFRAESMVIATGGLSLSKIGATDFWYRIAAQFGIRVMETAAALEALCLGLRDWRFASHSRIDSRAAEVARSGVGTRELPSRTMGCRKVPGLCFIGEVVDVTGWLGGDNFQWAWVSGWTAGQAV